MPKPQVKGLTVVIASVRRAHNQAIFAKYGIEIVHVVRQLWGMRPVETPKPGGVHLDITENFCTAASKMALREIARAHLATNFARVQPLRLDPRRHLDHHGFSANLIEDTPA